MIEFFDTSSQPNTVRTQQAQGLIEALYRAMNAHAEKHEFSDAAVISALGSLLVWACNKTGCQKEPLLAGLAREIKQ